MVYSRYYILTEQFHPTHDPKLKKGGQSFYPFVLKVNKMTITNVLDDN